MAIHGNEVMGQVRVAVIAVGTVNIVNKLVKMSFVKNWSQNIGYCFIKRTVLANIRDLNSSEKPCRMITSSYKQREQYILSAGFNFALLR